MNHHTFLVAMMVTIQVKMYMCRSTELFYVLPDHSTNADCPSQPCVTLSRHFLNININMSNITLLFLLGKHTLTYSITMEYAHNITMIGMGYNNLAPGPAKIFCNSDKPAIVAVNSSNIRIANLVFENCGGYGPLLEYQVDSVIIATAFLSTCYYCNVTNVKFIGYGLAVHNLLGESHLSNIIIHLCETSHSMSHWIHKGIYLIIYGRSPHYIRQSLIYVNRITIILDSDLITFTYDNYFIVGIYIYSKTYGYNNTLMLSNSNFHYINNVNAILTISSAYNKRSRVMLWIKNCEFSHNDDSRVLIDISISYNNVALIFTNCLFYMNKLDNLLPLVLIQVHNGYTYVNSVDWCLFPSYIGIKNSSFIENKSPILKIQGNRNSKCVTRFSIIGSFVTKENNGMTGDLISIHDAIVNVIGEATFTYNSNAINILLFYSCNVTFSKDISFIMNGITHPFSIDSVITLESDSAYIKVMEGSNITFIDNDYVKQLIQIKAKDYTPYPLCMFQYDTLALKNVSHSLMKNYSISFYGGYKLPSYFTEVDSSVTFSINYYTFHCKWLRKTIFYGSDYHPGDINKQIIHTDDRNMYQHTRVCYCFMNNTYDCSLDLLGPAFPGQVLQVNLCVPHEPDSNEVFILYAETHNTFLPSSACKVANQNQLINTITNSPRTYNFTIVSDSTNECELFLTAEPDLYKRYDAFYVQLLPCPIGFTLQDGVCDCDHVLSTVIDKCYIDYSTIRRPANSWIVARTQANDTKYLVSSCVMDYCLPYSSNVNLLYPDLQCQFNRGGILCSQCPHPLSMILGSSRCMKCTNVHILITIIVIVAGILLVVLLYVLNLTVTNGSINGIIFYANIVSINDSVFLVNNNVFKPIRVFISFTNLDLGIETCFYNGMDSYAKMWLQLFFPSYLIIIAVSIIVASRYSTRILRLTYTRSLPVLATLFLLSYTGVLRTVLTVLFSYSTITHLPSGHHQMVWSIDASVSLFGIKFTILFITCLVLLLLLIPFNIMLLFTRCFLRFRIVNRFKPLLDAFQGSYKDKYYYWVAVHLVLRSLFFTFYGFPEKLKLILSTMLLIIFGIYSGYVRPNKNKVVNIQELLLLINLTIMYAVSYQGSIFFTVTNVMISLAFVQFGTIVFYNFLTYTCHCDIICMLQTTKQKLMIKLCKKKSLSCASNNIALLNVPERTYNYNEYRDGLVSDDFKQLQ